MASLGIMELIVLMLVGLLLVLPVVLCYRLAGAKGRSRWKWALLGIVFGFIALAVLALLGPAGGGNASGESLTRE